MPNRLFNRCIPCCIQRGCSWREKHVIVAVVIILVILVINRGTASLSLSSPPFPVFVIIVVMHRRHRRRHHQFSKVRLGGRRYAEGVIGGFAFSSHPCTRAYLFSFILCIAIFNQSLFFKATQSHRRPPRSTGFGKLHRARACISGSSSGVSERGETCEVPDVRARPDYRGN